MIFIGNYERREKIVKHVVSVASANPFPKRRDDEIKEELIKVKLKITE